MDFGLPARLALTLALWLALSPAGALSEDVVTLSSPTNRRARSRISGEVLEYTGRQLVVRLPDGREIKRPGQNVVSIETQWPAGKEQGDRLFEQQQFYASGEKYLAATRQESRGWARRALLARLIACHRELNQVDAAGKLFLALVREDPDSPYFDEIPLAWFTAEVGPAQEQLAREWLSGKDPLAQLLGASLLLATNDRQQALDRLSQLALEKDDRIASLAEAQIWRVSIPTANDDKLAAWERRIESFPERLRAGPYWVLGRALSQHGHADRALVALLHVPLLYPQARLLAADALHSSAQLLDKQGEQQAAQRLRRELVANYGETTAAASARSLLPANEQVMPGPTPPDEGENLEQSFLAGLRARRLFSLAEGYCRRRLSETGVSEVTRVDLAIELSRTLGEHALHEAQADRDGLWEEAITAVQAPTGGPIKGSRRLLLDAQAAVVHLAHGELARQEAELSGPDDASFEAARKELRAAVAGLDRTLKAVAAELRVAGQSKRSGSGDLNANELAGLTRTLDYQLTRAFRNQGQSYPHDSADRTNSLRQAVERLKLLAAAEVDDAVAWPARLDEVVCLRLLELFDAAETRLVKLEEVQPPPAFAAALQAEQIRLSLDRRQLERALAAADKARASGTEITPDLEYACLEAYIAAWHAAEKGQRSADAAGWQDRAEDLIADIDERFGKYWRRRAEMLLADSVTRGGDTQNLAVLVRAAESLYRSGQLAQALEAYDRAARQAAQAQQADAAFDYAFTAAAIEERAGHHAEAATRFRKLAIGAPAHERAGEAHLLAIYNTARAAKAGDSVSSPAYLDLLNEHLSQWPRSPTADQVRLWLGAFYERERRWPEAIAAYQAVRLDHPQATTAVEGVSRSFERWLTELAAAGDPTSDVAARGASYLEKIVINARGGLPERWSQLERIAATGAASILLAYGENEFARAQRLLSAALADAADAPEDWRATAQTLEVFAVAAQGQREKAAELLNELSGGEPRQVLALIERLARVADNARPAVARELAELQLRAAALLEARLKELPAGEQRDFQLAYVRALAAAKRREEAIVAARKLAESFPRDGQIQEEYAGLLLDSTDRAAWQEALAKWRDIGQKTRQGSERWLRAMYSQAAALVRLGEKQQAARLIKLTEAISPDLGGPDLKARFRALLK
ncbi:MAG TPA: hypothetical protein VFI31_03405 [Pirellulales bacterium]|nr:hypothetical protein [Pirellulales bacterium]